MDKYVNIVIDTISIALPVCIRAVPANTKTRSGYAIAAANEEFFVKFRYWFVVGGIIILNAWGMITSFKTWLGVKPNDAAASFWPLLIPCIPALTHSATNVAVYKDKANVSAINSGGTATPPSYINEVAESCFNTGISKFNETPPAKNVKAGSIINIIKEI